jgi:hypothetical protein
MGSRFFQIVVSVLAGSAVAVAGAIVLAQYWPICRSSVHNVTSTNPYSKQYEAEKKFSEQRGIVRTRDPIGRVVLFPGMLLRLYWPPGQAEKDCLTLEDITLLALGLEQPITSLKPDTVIFNAVVCTPDTDSQRRIRERNCEMRLRPAVLPPPSLNFDRIQVPITIHMLMTPVPREVLSFQDAVLLCILTRCHRLPPGDPPRMAGYPIPARQRYDPSIPYNIEFAALPGSEDHPAR